MTTSKKYLFIDNKSEINSSAQINIAYLNKTIIGNQIFIGRIDEL